ncbi:MAG: TerD family protein [Acidaminobacteraceae bacterium]
MKIAVESGKREPFAFENSKIKVDGSSGLFYNGQISISKNNKIIYAGGENLTSTQSSKAKQVSTKSSSASVQNLVSSAQEPNQVAKKSKAKLETLGIDRSTAKTMNAGQKLGINDIGIVDNKLVIGVELEYKSSAFEVDFSMFLLDEAGKSTEDNFIFYGNKLSKDTSIKIDDDLSLKISGGFDNVISVDLNKVDSSIKRISLTATLYDESNKFGNLKSGSISLISTSKREVLNYKFTEKLTSENAIVICDLYSHSGKWKLQGIGQGFNGGLSALCGNFGVDTM